MSYTWLERFRNWLCLNFGHRSEFRTDYGYVGEEHCKRCKRLLSTAYSRERARIK